MSIQAMKMALEALGNCESMLSEYHQWLSDAQYELRAAIKAAEKVEPVGKFSKFGIMWKSASFVVNAPEGTLLYTHPPQPAFPAWQPIETAPKDGTHILLCRAHPNPDIPIAVSDGQWLETRNGHWDWVWPYIRKEPTHWMPLPAAPKQEGE